MTFVAAAGRFEGVFCERGMSIFTEGVVIPEELCTFRLGRLLFLLAAVGKHTSGVACGGAFGSSRSEGRGC